MEQVFFCAQRSPDAVVRRVFAALQPQGGAVLCSAELTVLAPHAQILLCALPGQTLLSAAGCIAVLCDDAPPSPEILSQCAVGVALSCHQAALQALSKAGVPAVTCSRVRDTLCISARPDDEHLQLCLQRSLKTLHGDVLEPFEFILEKRGCTQEELLLAAAVLLLLGAIK